MEGYENTKKIYDHYSVAYKEVIERFPTKEYSTFIHKYPPKDICLLVGFMKSGNTWLRFLITHYYLLLKNELSDLKSLSFKELNTYQYHSIEKQKTANFHFEDMKIIRSHIKYIKGFEHFNILYISRNPLDTLVSKYHYLSKRGQPFKSYPEALVHDLLDIDNYVLFEIDNWIEYHQSYLKRKDLHITYENLKNNPHETMKKIITFLGWVCDESLIKKSIELSSFNSLKQSSIHNSESSGMAKGYKGVFVRKGKIGSYNEELKPETIEKINFLLVQKKIIL